jgi:hypothetical protein
MDRDSVSGAYPRERAALHRGRIARRYSIRCPTAIANRSIVEPRASTSPDSSRATAGCDVPILAATSPLGEAERLTPAGELAQELAPIERRVDEFRKRHVLARSSGDELVEEVRPGPSLGHALDDTSFDIGRQTAPWR